MKLRAPFGGALAGVLAALALAAGPGRATAPARAAQPLPPPSAIQHPGLRPPLPEEARPPHRSGELECRACHPGKHVGIVQMYIGIGGRGTPTIPSHMFQVRVECIACHTAPKIEEPTAGLVGQTFRPSERACLTCHGEKYRGMLERWTTTLARMIDAVSPKLGVARAALAVADRRDPRTARASTLADDAEFNIRYVVLAKGVHNVFYAADMLKLANGWLDEALALLGKPSVGTDDALVRGGYCAALCHEAAKVQVPESVSFAKRRIPHGRHVTEFGATCTSCHSAETHKAVTATAATCAGCHHSPQNERCESCHRPQAAFYRGETGGALAPVAPNLMAGAVGCPACHDFTRKHSRAAVGERCLGCHEAPYAALLTEWTAGFDADLATATAAVRKAEAAVARARRAGRKAPEAEALLGRARAALALVRTARPAHNPLAADALLEAARGAARAAAAAAAR